MRLREQNKPWNRWHKPSPFFGEEPREGGNEMQRERGCLLFPEQLQEATAASEYDRAISVPPKAQEVIEGAAKSEAYSKEDACLPGNLSELITRDQKSDGFPNSCLQHR